MFKVDNFMLYIFYHNKNMKRDTRPPLNRERACRSSGYWLPPAVLDKFNIGVAKLAQALLQILAKTAQGNLGDINVAKQLLVQCAAESDQPGDMGGQRGDLGLERQPGRLPELHHCAQL